MNKEEYYKYIEENDTYPEHSHKWIVRTYTDAGIHNPNEVFYRNFGPFNTKDEAVLFIGGYKMKYTTQGFITRWTVQALCEVL
jgi:ribonucleotide reductase beta subunit family protein with ferritin-like domain